MRTRDWGILGARLMAVLFLSNALYGIVYLIDRLVPLEPHFFPDEFASAVGPVVVYLGLAVVLWVYAPSIATSLVTADEESLPRGGEGAFRKGLRIGLVIAGALLAADALAPLVSNALQYVDPPRSSGFGNEYFRDLSLTYVLANLVKVVAGLALVLGSRSLSERVDLSGLEE